jgi:peroxiredoxin
MEFANTMIKIILVLVLLAGILSLEACSGTNNGGLQTNSPAPDFQLIDLSGQSISLESSRGKIIFLNFWETTCVQCVTEMPVLQSFYQDWASRNNIILLAIDIGEDTDNVKYFVQSHNYTFPVLLDSSSQVAEKYGIRYTPTSLFINQDGRLKISFIGAFTDEAAIEKQVTSLLQN